ncbi:MAG TPA: hypothetical protein VHQ48_03500 [Bradyrhizobium sp.]|jgi:hypothetical protein|nr:hypothetical protein [Bradyrhizobium sp.]
MLRFAIALIAGVVTSGAAESADRALLHHRGPRATVGLPAGLPRPHYNFRTTITLSEPYTYPRPSPRFSLYEAPERLYAPVYADAAYISGPAVAPLLPGYYGSSYSFTDGPYVPYWDRLPYACGVYGYC